MKSNYETLFNDWQKLGRNVASLGAIVQNDPAEFPPTAAIVEVYKADSRRVYAELRELMRQTLAAVEDVASENRR